MTPLRIDGFALAPPLGDPPLAGAYVRGLAVLHELVLSQVVQPLLLNETAAVMFSEGSYPNVANLRRILGESVPVEPVDVARMADGIFKRAQFCDPVAAANLQVDGTDYLVGRSAGWCAHHYQTVMGACLDVENRVYGNRPLVVSRALGRPRRDVDVQAHLTSAASDGRWSATVCEACDGLWQSLDAAEMWCSGANPDGRVEAIVVAVRQLGLAVGATDPDARPWTVGPGFVRSSEALGFTRSPTLARKLMRAAAETILGENNSAVHGLRTGPGGGVAQRTQGGRKAWRRDIDYTHHIHYWDGASGPELAVVVPHDDFSIPDPSGSAPDGKWPR